MTQDHAGRRAVMDDSDRDVGVPWLRAVRKRDDGGTDHNCHPVLLRASQSSPRTSFWLVRRRPSGGGFLALRRVPSRSLAPRSPRSNLGVVRWRYDDESSGPALSLMLRDSLSLIFSKEKHFDRGDVIGSRWLNRLGLHVARSVLAHASMWRRRRARANGVDIGISGRFYRDGVVVVPGFLEQAKVAEILAELAAAGPDAFVRHLDGDTVCRRFIIRLQPSDDGFAACRLLASRPDLQRLLCFGAGTDNVSQFFIEVVEHGNPVLGDPQKVLHSDTFHPTMKAWIYLTDVKAGENAVFEYVRASNRMTWRRLWWEYRKSLHAAKAGDHTSEGSFRLDHRLPAPPATRYEVSSGTFLMADTRGFHRRGDAVQGAVRVALHAWSRTNPYEQG